MLEAAVAITLGVGPIVATWLMARSPRTQYWAAWPLGTMLAALGALAGALAGAFLKSADAAPEAEPVRCGMPLAAAAGIIGAELMLAFLVGLALLARRDTHTVGVAILCKATPVFLGVTAVAALMARWGLL
jgi:hypothetical protein